jgi:hypothetical protein
MGNCLRREIGVDMNNWTDSTIDLDEVNRKIVLQAI